jgi:hypothetical protein
MGRDIANEERMQGRKHKDRVESRADAEACLDASRAALQAPQRRLPNLNVSLLFPV